MTQLRTTVRNGRLETPRVPQGPGDISEGVSAEQHGMQPFKHGEVPQLLDIT